MAQPKIDDGTILWLNNREPIAVDSAEAKKHGLRSGDAVGPGLLEKIRGRVPRTIEEAAIKAVEDKNAKQGD